MVKRLPAVRETQVRFLGREDPLEKGKATHSSILAWVAKSQTRLSDFHFTNLENEMNGEEIRLEESQHTGVIIASKKKNFFFKLNRSCFGPQHMKQIRQYVSSSLF